MSYRRGGCRRIRILGSTWSKSHVGELVTGRNPESSHIAVHISIGNNHSMKCPQWLNSRPTTWLGSVVLEDLLDFRMIIVSMSSLWVIQNNTTARVQKLVEKLVRSIDNSKDYWITRLSLACTRKSSYKCHNYRHASNLDVQVAVIVITLLGSRVYRFWILNEMNCFSLWL